MAGIKRGPAPKDPEVRQRRNIPAAGVGTKVTPDQMPAYVDTNPTPPEPNPTWHPVAREIWDGLLSDPARMNMTTADWALSKMMVENISRDMYPQVVATIAATVDSETGTVIPGEAIRESVAMNGARMAAVLKWAAMINLTDSARRSVGLHITLGVAAGQNDQPVEDVVTKRADLFIVPPEDDTA